MGWGVGKVVYPQGSQVVKATVCKTVYRWFESSPWDHVVESKSALARAPFLVVTATVTATGMDGYGRSASRTSIAAAASRCMVGVTWL